MRGAEPKTPSHPRPIGEPTFSPTRRDWWLFPVGLAIFWFIFNGPPMSALGDIDLEFGLPGPLASTPWHWAGAMLLIVLVIVGERRGLASMLLTRPSGKDLEWALIAFGCSMAWSWLASLLWPEETSDGTQQIVSLGVIGVLVMIVTAAVTEEIVYRGYLAERLGTLTGSRWLGAALSLAIFVVPHVVFFGPSWLLHHFVGAIAIATVVLVRRNLWVGVLVHLGRNAPILIPTFAAM